MTLSLDKKDKERKEDEDEEEEGEEMNLSYQHHEIFGLETFLKKNKPHS